MNLIDVKGQYDLLDRLRAPVMVFRRVTGRCAWANKAALQVFQLSSVDHLAIHLDTLLQGAEVNEREEELLDLEIGGDVLPVLGYSSTFTALDGEKMLQVELTAAAPTEAEEINQLQRWSYFSHRVLDTATSPVLVVDGADRFVYMNRAAALFLEVFPAQALDRPVDEHLAVFAPGTEALASLLPSGTLPHEGAREEAVSFVMRDGTVHHFNRAASFLERPDGTKDRLMIFTDITARVRAEQELLLREQRFEDFAHASSDWFWEMDENLCFTWFSDFRRPHLRPLMRQWIGRSRHEIAHLSPQTPAMKEHLECLEQRKPFKEFIYSITAANNKKTYLKTSGIPVFDAEGQFKGYRGSGQDVTERVQTQERVARLERQLKDAVESTSAGFALFDPDDRLVICNEAYHKMFPASMPQAIPGDRFEAILRRSVEHGSYAETYVDHGDVETWVNHLVQLHQATLPDGRHYQTRNGRFIQVMERRTSDGGIVSIYSDLTEQRQREVELAEARDAAELADRTKSGFLATISHEIRTPMNGIVGLSDLLSQSDLNEEQSHQLSLIRSAADSLLRIINDVLDFSAMAAGRLSLDETPLLLHDSLKEVTQFFDGKVQKNDITLDLTIHKDVPDCVMIDGSRLRQILFNLVSNAVKFTPQGGSIGLTVGPGVVNPGFYRFQVKDTGVGISKAGLATLFEEFMRVHDTKSISAKGTGLGLAICKRLVDLMGGKIGVDSELGSGSTFWFELPLSPHQPCDKKVETVNIAQKPDTTGPDGGATAQGRLILVVEDNDINQRVVCTMLKRAGHTFTVANNGREALEKLQAEGPFDMILMDIQMPEMDGLEATRAIRALADQTLASTPIVALTANALEKDRDACMEAGMDFYLAKPVRTEMLVNTVKEWARKPD